MKSEGSERAWQLNAKPISTILLKRSKKPWHIRNLELAQSTSLGEFGRTSSLAASPNFREQGQVYSLVRGWGRLTPQVQFRYKLRSYDISETLRNIG